MKKMIMNFLKDEEGVTAMEYALIAALVSVVAIVAWTSLGTAVDKQVTAVGTAVNGAGAEG